MIVKGEASLFSVKLEDFTTDLTTVAAEFPPRQQQQTVTSRCVSARPTAT